jgi:sphingomyelin phosphodiesterase acid-like 3
MGHIPPGVDAYSTFSHLTNVCDGGKPTTFLSSDALSDLLVEYASTIQLAIFGHTHMDEMHLLTSATVSDTSSEPPTEVPLKAVPLKMVPSISPVDGNNPAFTLAQISPKTSRLVDYQVIAASNQTGLDTTWSPEYSFQDTYHQPEFSALTLSTLLDGFQSDPSASTPPSQAYLRNYFVGDRSLLLRTLWPQYTCSLAHPDVKGFDGCVCALPK